MVLEAHKLTKTYDSLTAVRQVSLSLEAGQMLALVGASGSGKSTLLSLLAGLTDADTGEIRFDNERVAGPADVLIPGHPQIRLVHQEYQLMPNVSIRENIAYALRFFEKSYQTFRVDQLLKLCRLQHVADRLPRQASGGEKQRTAIARALADKPAVLLLDEPFSHLDLPNRQLMRDLLFDLVRHDQTACLFVTHDATDALSIADTLGIMREGRLIQTGTPQAIYRQPQTAYTARLTGSVNILKAKHLPLLGLPAEQNQAPVDPEALCCLRPEQISLADTGATGIVRASYFKGSHFEIELALSRYVRLRLLTTQPDLQVGQSVRFQAQADAICWLT